jgi:hypothetical protein
MVDQWWHIGCNKSFRNKTERIRNERIGSILKIMRTAYEFSRILRAETEVRPSTSLRRRSRETSQQLDGPDDLISTATHRSPVALLIQRFSELPSWALYCAIR